MENFGTLRQNNMASYVRQALDKYPHADTKKKIPKNILDKHILYIREYLICITLSPHRQKREEKAAHP